MGGLYFYIGDFLMEDLITAQEFFDYNGGETDVLGPVQLAISMACTVIENYLKYDPHQKTRVDSFDGDNTDWLLLKAIPVSQIASVKINGKEVSSDNFEIYESRLVYKDNVFPNGYKNIVITYVAGYTDDTLPPIFKSTCCRIAGVLYSETHGNIGVTSKSFANEGTKTFVNTTNFDRFLMPLSIYALN